MQWLGAPMIIRGRPLGVLEVFDYADENAYGEEEKQLLTFIAGQTALAIERNPAGEFVESIRERGPVIIGDARLADDLNRVGIAGCAGVTLSFDGATRSLRQEGPGRATLHGNVRALPAPDQPHTHFGFDCEVDPRDGRVLSTRISG